LHLLDVIIVACQAFLDMMRGRDDEVSFALVVGLLAAGPTAGRRHGRPGEPASRRLTTQIARFGRSASDQGGRLPPG